MFRISLASILDRKVRLLSTALAIVIGVAFLAGTLVLTDTIGRTFDDLFTEVNAEVDAVVRSDEVIESDFGDLRGTIDDELLDVVRAVDGVAAAQPTVQGYAQLVDDDGEAMGNPGQGPPTLGFAWSTVPELNPMRLVEGRAPTAADEIVIDRQSADDGPFAVGDAATVLTQGAPRELTVVGIATFGSADSPLGASVVLFAPDVAAEILGKEGSLDSIELIAEDGVSQEALADRVAAVLPGGTEVVTGEAFVEETQDTIAEALSFFNTFMLIFAAIALFVAAFIIYNTFSILVAQRTRELALLRALGAYRHQIVVSVLAEAVLIGVVASILGIVAGLGVAKGLEALLDATGLAIPAGGIVFVADTAWISLLVGVVVTVVSALTPSWRASRIAPMAALREAQLGGTRGIGVRALFGAALLVVGVAVLSWGLFGDPPDTAIAIGGGAALVFIGVTAIAPTLAVPFARIAGAPLARLGVPGEIAQENAMRNPKRTASTAAALMIGVGLVGAISIFATSAKASIDVAIDDAVIGDFIIDSGAFGFGGLSPDLATELNDLPEVEAASGVRLGFAEVAGSSQVLYGIDPDTMGEIVDVDIVEGALAELGPTSLAVHDEEAAANGWRLGTTVPVRFAETGVRDFTVDALYTKSELTGDFFTTQAAFEENYREQLDFQIYLTTADGVGVEEARAAITGVADAYPSAEVQDLSEFKDSQAAQIDQLLNLIYALLGLAIIIALVGIANTLGLSILERTRELGLLRAVGMTRRQLRSAVRWESTLISVFGALLGLAIGLFFGWVIGEALRDEGFTEFRIPWVQLVVIVVLAALAGVLAALRPARRAARLDILRAVATE